MNLQFALIGVGILLIVVIYAVSRRIDRGQKIKTSAGSDKRKLSGRDEPSLVDSQDDYGSNRLSPNFGIDNLADQDESGDTIARSQSDSTVGTKDSNNRILDSDILELGKDTEAIAVSDLDFIDELSDDIQTLEDRMEQLVEDNVPAQRASKLSTESNPHAGSTESGEAKDDGTADKDELNLESISKSTEMPKYNVDQDETIPELDEPIYTSATVDKTADLEDGDAGQEQIDETGVEDSDKVDSQVELDQKEIKDVGNLNEAAPQAKSETLDGQGKARVEPTLGIVSETPVSTKILEQEHKRGSYQYPKIAGFEKISQIDYWVKISGDRDVGRESVLAQYRDMVSSISKPCTIHGLKLPEKKWCNLENESEDSRFGDLVITIQLADQRGSIREKDLNRFTTLISNLSEGTGRGFTFMAPIENAMNQAAAIAEFVHYYESIFIINIKPERDGYFEGNTISRCAVQLGLEQSENNNFVRNKSVGKDKVCLYSLANMSETGKFDFDHIKDQQLDGVIFFTKPAVNGSPGAVFSEMVDTAKAFAARTKGRVVTPKSDDLSQEDVDRIRQSIETVAQEMEQIGMAPGSDEAMRIF